MKRVMCADPDCFNTISNVDLTLNPNEEYCRRCKLRTNTHMPKDCQEEIDQEVARLTRIAHPYDLGNATEQLEKELYTTLTAERTRHAEDLIDEYARGFNDGANQQYKIIKESNLDVK